MHLRTCVSEEGRNGEGVASESLCLLSYTLLHVFLIVVYYETINRELNRRLIYECQCDVRLKLKLTDLLSVIYTSRILCFCIMKR